MILPLEKVPVPPTSPNGLFSRQVVSQTLPSRAWASSEVAAITLGVILGVIILVALGYLANHFLRLLMRKIEQSVFQRVLEHLESIRESQNAALVIGDGQERGPSSRYSPDLWQQIRRRAPPSPSPRLERQSDTNHFPDFHVSRSPIGNHNQRATSPVDVERISQRSDSRYRGRLPHPRAAYHRAQSPSLVGRPQWERYKEALADAQGLELPGPLNTQMSNPPQPPSRGREQGRRQRDIQGVDRINRTDSLRQSSLPPGPSSQPWREESVRHVGPTAISADDPIQENEYYYVGPEDRGR